MNVTYHPDDKVMVLSTGEVFTVEAEVQQSGEEYVQIRENGHLLKKSEIRPAGKTRSFLEASGGIIL